MSFSAYVGRTYSHPVTDDYPPVDTAFTATIKGIEIEGGDDTHDHLVDPEMAMNLLIAKKESLGGAQCPNPPAQSVKCCRFRTARMTDGFSRMRRIRLRQFPPIAPTLPPAGAPNVLVVLIDDTGFGASSAFGGLAAMPNAERLAAGGLKFNRFHTTALCAPTCARCSRAAITMRSTWRRSPSSPHLRPGTPPSVPEHRAAGRDLEAQRLQHRPVREVPRGARLGGQPDRAVRPVADGGGGFETFYGFIAGETNQYYPALYEGTIPIEQPKTPAEGYHFTEDMTDKAIGWVRQQRSLMPDKPFFVYYAPGATHAPHQVPTEWSDKYKGRFDAGWDTIRDETFARQKELGVIPADAELTPRHDEIPAWDEMPDELKPVLARQMEVYAGFLEHTDHHIGRLLDTLEELDVLEDTLVYYIIGDNGASAEGTINGTFNELLSLNGAAAFETAEMMSAHIDEFGTPRSYNHYAVGWATRWTPRTSGRSRSRRTGVARGTARSCTGRMASMPKVRCAVSSVMSSMSRRPCLTSPASRSPTS